MKKTILLCGNGLSGDIISTIKSWGYNVLLISEFPDDRGVEYADGYIEANSKSVNDSIVAADSFFIMAKNLMESLAYVGILLYRLLQLQLNIICSAFH